MNCNCGAPTGHNVFHDSDCPVWLLRAAAPDLLAACKELLAVVESLPQGHSMERVTSANAGRAAIEKAEGGQK